MRALLQRVSRASVSVDGTTIASIGPGLVVLLGVGHGDDEATADALARRVTELRIFRDDEGRTNRSIIDIGGAALVVSQFTLYADTARGRRPGFTNAADPAARRAPLPALRGGPARRRGRGRPDRLVRGRDGGRARQRRPVHDLARYRPSLKGPERQPGSDETELDSYKASSRPANQYAPSETSSHNPARIGVGTSSRGTRTAGRAITMTTIRRSHRPSCL